jgi:surfeit locus 1 family protein
MALSTALGLGLFIFLGQWQLERASFKQAIIKEYVQRAELEPIKIDTLTSDSDWLEHRFRRGVVHGRYDLQRQWLLDNRTHHGRAGYHVITPLQIAESETIVLVNRGWVPVGDSRARLPDLPGPTDEVVVRGTINSPPVVFQLAPDPEHDGNWPTVVQSLKLDRMAAEIGLAVLPFVMYLTPHSDDGFVREFRAVYGISPDKHRAYAVQWFIFAVTLLGIYIGVNTRRIDR